MNKVFCIDKTTLHKDKKTSLFFTLLSFLLMLVIEVILFIILNRSNKIIVMILMLLAFVIFVFVFSYLAFYKIPYLKSYILEAEKSDKNLVNISGTVDKINSEKFAKNHLFYRNIEILSNEKRLSFEVLDDSVSSLKEGKEYNFKIKGSTLYEYEEK